MLLCYNPTSVALQFLWKLNPFNYIYIFKDLDRVWRFFSNT